MNIDNRPLETSRHGHVDLKHVAKDWDFLVGRISNEEALYSTSLPNQDVATTCISLTLDAHQAAIKQFLADPKPTALKLCARFSEAVGYGVIYSNLNERICPDLTKLPN